MLLILQAAAETAVSSGVDLTTIITSIIGTVGVGGVIKLFQVHTKSKRDKRKEANAGTIEFKDSLKERVIELEDKVDGLQDKIEEMIKMYTDKIIALSTETATLRAENKGYVAEIDELKSEIHSIKNN
tara:strand:+ start:264 stop:647 length:384 start_codon:yes stop_codon:yes gene_type:complete